MNIHALIRKAMKLDASDIHLVTGLPPALRIAGEIIMTDEEVLTDDGVRDLVFGLLGDDEQKRFEQDKQACFSTVFEDTGHVRVSVYTRLGRVEAAVRLRSFAIRGLAELGLPESVAALTGKPNGLVLITGPTGVGKTTTFYAMIDRINQERRAKVVTIEDPIEYLFTPRRSIIVQQEIGKDATSFHSALMHVLRLDPDIICIGEMRDSDTISAALLAAETGHLVIATLHTTGAAQTVERVITAFPPDQRGGAAVQLANVIRGVVSQALLPTVDKKSRVLACEVMLSNSAVRNNIRELRIQAISDVIQSGTSEGMRSLDMALRDLYQAGLISYDTAATHARDPKMLLDHGRKRRPAPAGEAS